MIAFGILTTVFGLDSPAHARDKSGRPESNNRWVDRDLAGRIDATVQRAIRDDKLPGGFTLAIVKQGRPVFIRAYGFADRESKHPMTNDAMFPIGSVTKTFTAALAVKLAARGTVKLDGPVVQYLPPGVTLNPGLTLGPITLTTLLTHRAGWPKDNATRRNLKLKLPGDFDPTIADPASFSKAEFYRGLELTKPLRTVPGERYYSNFGFHFAAHILELASGRSMEQLVTDEMVTPLRMVDTTFYPSALQAARIPAGYALDEANDRSVRVPPWRAGEIVGGAFLHSTAESVAKFVALMMDKDATTKFLGGNAWDNILLHPYIEYIDGDAWRAQALAWQISNFGPYGPILRHSGHSDGHNAYVALSRFRQLGLVLLTNNDAGANDHLGNELLLLLMQHDRKVGSNTAAR